MKDTNRYCLKIKVYTKKHKYMYKKREQEECNPGGTQKTSTLFVMFYFFN